jgi:hypothetical protein
VCTRPPCFLRELIIEPPRRPLIGPLGGRRGRATCLPPFQALACQQRGMTANRASLRIRSRSLQPAAATSRANAPTADGGDAEKLEADEGDGASQFNPALLTETLRSSMFGMKATLVLRLQGVVQNLGDWAECCPCHSARYCPLLASERVKWRQASCSTSSTESHAFPGEQHHAGHPSTTGRKTRRGPTRRW